MKTKAADHDAPAKDRHLPPMVQVGDIIAPKAPQDIAAARLEDATLTDLLVKLAYAMNRFTVDVVCKRLHVSPHLGEAMLEQLTREGLIVQSMVSSESKPRYKITERG